MHKHSKPFFFASKVSKLVALAGLLTCAYSCSNSSTSSSISRSNLSNAIGAIGVTSPTVHTTTSSASLFNLKSIWNFFQNKNFFFAPKAYALSTTPTLQSFASFQTTVNTLLASATVEAALANFNLNSISAPAVSCYGPSVGDDNSSPTVAGFANHPDGGTCTGRGGVCALPGGDLGIWVDTETNNEACSAAKVNALTAQLQAVSLQGLTLMTGVNVAAQLQGASLPAAGASIDVTTSVAAALSSVFTVSSATLSGLTESGGFPVYQTQVTGTDASSNPISFTLKHSPTSSDNSTYTGIFYGYMPQSNNAIAFSLIYTKTASTITYLLKTGETQSPSKDASTLIAADGTLNFSATAFAGNGYRILSEIDTTTNLGTMNLAWQAGSGDGNTRVFRANTSTSGASTTGFSYFGFGPAITVTDGTLGSITKMICHWTGTTNGSHTGLANKAQAQEMTLNTTTGVFELTTGATNHTTYANTNSCDYTPGTYTMSQWQGEAAHPGSLTTAPSGLPITGSTNLVTVDTPSIGVIPTITEPSVPF